MDRPAGFHHLGDGIHHGHRDRCLMREYWAIVAVDASVESKWSTRKARVEVVGDITHPSLELIAN
jgi:hypothetical protein